jgi:predicted homoserine dehydrogenase-like protein
MSGKETVSYDSPEVTAYGSVESITEQKNKYQLGADTDINAINLEGSVGFK